MAILDQLDKRILQYLSDGISSYEELAKECNVTRNTIYRRMAALEKRGITQKTTRVAINYDKLGIGTIVVAFNVQQKNQEEILTCLRAYSRVKFLFKTYGAHNIVVFALCDRGEEGQTINDIKSIAEKYNPTQIDVSIGYSWEKIDFTPYAIEVNLENQPIDAQTTVKEQVMLISKQAVLPLPVLGRLEQSTSNFHPEPSCQSHPQTSLETPPATSDTTSE